MPSEKKLSSLDYVGLSISSCTCSSFIILGNQTKPNLIEPHLRYGTVAKVDAKSWDDAGRLLLFGPDQVSKRNPYPKWSHTIMKKQDRFAGYHEPPHAKTELDPYGVRHKDSFLNKRFDGRVVFGR